MERLSPPATTPLNASDRTVDGDQGLLNAFGAIARTVGVGPGILSVFGDIAQGVRYIFPSNQLPVVPQAPTLDRGSQPGRVPSEDQVVEELSQELRDGIVKHKNVYQTATAISTTGSITLEVALVTIRGRQYLLPEQREEAQVAIASAGPNEIQVTGFRPASPQAAIPHPLGGEDGVEEGRPSNSQTHFTAAMAAVGELPGASQPGRERSGSTEREGTIRNQGGDLGGLRSLLEMHSIESPLVRSQVRDPQAADTPPPPPVLVVEERPNSSEDEGANSSDEDRTSVPVTQQTTWDVWSGKLYSLNGVEHGKGILKVIMIGLSILSCGLIPLCIYAAAKLYDSTCCGGRAHVIPAANPVLRT